MTNKQSLLNIVLGSLVISLAGTYLHYATSAEAGHFEFAAGMFVIAFVVLLFLTSFLPSRTQTKATKQTATRDSGRVHAKRQRSSRGGSNRNRGGGSKSTPGQATPASHQPASDGHATSSEVDGNTNLLSGTIKWFNKRKGFGFIQYQNQDVFFHHNEVVPSTHQLRDNAPVEFVMGSSNKGPQAVQVKVTGPQPKE